MERYTIARRGAGLPAGLCLLVLGACSQSAGPQSVPPLTMEQIPGHDTVAQDNSTKEPPRLSAAESYMRTYLMLFGNLTALQAQAQDFGQQMLQPQRFLRKSIDLLAHHGLVAIGATIERAEQVLAEIEALCGIYLQALAVAEPPLLTPAQMAEVHARFRGYGRAQRV